MGAGLNLHLKDSRQHPAQDRACCTHTAGYPRFPGLRPIGAPGDSRFPAESGNGGFPDSRIPADRARESEIPSPFPGQIGNRGNGNWGFPGLGWCARWSGSLGFNLPVNASATGRHVDRRPGRASDGVCTGAFQPGSPISCQCLVPEEELEGRLSAGDSVTPTGPRALHGTCKAPVQHSSCSKFKFRVGVTGP